MTIAQTVENIPQPQAILRAWMPFKKLVGVTRIRSEDDYLHVCAMVETLLGEIGDDGSHPLADVLDFLSDQIKAYEDEHHTIRHKCSPHGAKRNTGKTLSLRL